MYKTKVFIKCNVAKPFFDFPKDKTRKDGLFPYCKNARMKIEINKRIIFIM